VISRNRASVAVLLIVAFFATMGAQAYVREQRYKLVGRRVSTEQFKGMDSFALGLVLGGLRGPLVMVLWTTAENQKHQKDLEDIDTKIELIRMLQDEFDSVHIFQMWNKAYNLSVQMSSYPNKYATILDALDYGRRVEAQRPDSINVLASMGEIYFNKLGESSEKQYYRDRVRKDTRHRAETGPRPGERGWQRTHHDPVIDANGRILPQFLAGDRNRTFPRDGKPKDGFLYTGAELQYLEPFNERGGFPYGVPTHALAYNYYKRAGALMVAAGQKHLQLSDQVIDSRAAVTLKYWADEESEHALRLEAALMGRRAPEMRDELDRVTADMTPKPAFVVAAAQAKEMAAEAIFSFGRSAVLTDDAGAEYRRHSKNQANVYNTDVYASHVLEGTALKDLALGNQAYLRLAAANAGLVPLPAGMAADAVKKAAVDHYRLAVDHYRRIILRHYVDDDVAAAIYPKFTESQLGKPFTKLTIAQADPKVYQPLIDRVNEEMRRLNRPNTYATEVAEYQQHIDRSLKRIESLK
jgi:hypothetical protein